MKISKWALWIVGIILAWLSIGVLLGDWIMLQMLFSFTHNGVVILFLLLLAGGTLLGIGMIPLWVMWGGFFTATQKASESPTKKKMWLTFLGYTLGAVVIAQIIAYITGYVVGWISNMF